MNSELIAKLAPITAEEERILQGLGEIERENYASGADFTVDSNKMLLEGQIIDIRTHTRFIEFPRHRHNYIEIIYMCRGQTRHSINDSTEILLEQGDLLDSLLHPLVLLQILEVGTRRLFDDLGE